MRFPFEFEGKDVPPTAKRRWKTNEEGMATTSAGRTDRYRREHALIHPLLR